jgi:hypothetical protein
MTKLEKEQFRWEVAGYLNAIADHPGDKETIIRGLEELEKWVEDYAAREVSKVVTAGAKLKIR